jgi:hypothetical protein
LASEILSSEPTVPTTVAPRCFAHWQAIRPTPPAAEWKRIVLTRLYPEGGFQEIARGEAFEQCRRGDFVGNPGRQFDRVPGGNIGGFRIGDADHAVRDPVADLQSTDVFAERGDDAGCFRAESGRHRQRVQTGAMIGVDEIDPIAV